MASRARLDAVHAISQERLGNRNQGEVRSPLTEVFGIHVFNERVQRQRLPKHDYRALQATANAGRPLDESIADSVASAMRDWAVELGATHYTHWFQPMTGLTAEKHDSFLSLTDDERIINEFSGSELIRGEPDASSFPHGGLRATFEARGYTAWDPTSPAFVRQGPEGKTLCIPTVFCSWTGEALDKKTPLLRSEEAVNNAASRLMNLLGGNHVGRVWSTVGVEQEYFLIDRRLALLRPDLIASGRTLFGAPAAKGQELSDNYFGAIDERVLGFMQDLEYDLWRLGIPVKTRHNEVAPAQFELAPIFKKSTVSTDQNMIIMELLAKKAHRHGFMCLTHEKPFAGVNGSGKHTNWSLSTDTGINLLDPGKTPKDNLHFILALTAIIRGVDLHADLLRSTIANAGNDHRLGANEAPPAIISIFLGTQLEAVISGIMGRSDKDNNDLSDIKLGVTTLPPLPRDSTDRNRTSPFAFTGNKFEFRAVGSSQSVAYPTTTLNAIVADSLNFLSDEIESLGDGPVEARVQTVVSRTLQAHQRIVFGGNNYSDEWAAEAEARGLPNLRDTATALGAFAAPHNIELFERTGVFSRREAESRLNVLYENYALHIRIEALSSLDIAKTMVLPAAVKYQGRMAETLAALKTTIPNMAHTGAQNELEKVSAIIENLRSSILELSAATQKLDDDALGPFEASQHCANSLIPLQVAVRKSVDELEQLVDDELWPLPKYRELLFLH